MLLTQISQQPVLQLIYKELLSADGDEIYLKPAKRYIPLNQEIIFKDIMISARRIDELAIGIKIKAEERDKSKNFGIYINPDKNSKFKFTEEDKIIVIG